MGIGTLNEGHLHASLKAMYVAHGGDAEVRVDGFVADAVRNDVIYEIQTGSFSGLTRKLSHLLDNHQVVLVHPIAANTTMLKQPKEKGDKVQRRRSPKHGQAVQIVSELVYIPTLLTHANFSVEVVLTEEEEVRVYDPRKRRGRGGWRVMERRLLEVVDTWRLSSPTDLFEFLQRDLPEPFTTKDLAEALEQPQSIGQKMAYCLRHGGVAEVCGKEGNALVYQTLSPLV